MIIAGIMLVPIVVPSRALFEEELVSYSIVVLRRMQLWFLISYRISF